MVRSLRDKTKNSLNLDTVYHLVTTIDHYHLKLSLHECCARVLVSVVVSLIISNTTAQSFFPSFNLHKLHSFPICIRFLFDFFYSKFALLASKCVLHPPISWYFSSCNRFTSLFLNAAMQIITCTQFICAFQIKKSN